MILLTGGTGFIGAAVLTRLQGDRASAVRVTARRPFASGDAEVVMASLDPEAQWVSALGGVATVIHTAARVHVMRDCVGGSLNEYRRVNVAGTLNLARQAAAAGVRRFVFISSIKVNGDHTTRGRPYRTEDVPAPVDPYGVSKYEAEKQLRELATLTGMEVVVIRPVLVYGPGVAGNFRTMLQCLARGLPLPLGAIHNRRSLVAVDNLVDLIITCVSHPAAGNETFLVSDGHDVSTTELLHRAAQALGTRARLLPVPMRLLQVTAHLLGRQDLATRLCGSLEVDIAKTREILGWTPPVSLDDALQRTAKYFRSGGGQ